MTEKKKNVCLPKRLIASRKLIGNLAKNDFKKKFAGSYFGVIWAFIQPTTAPYNGIISDKVLLVQSESGGFSVREFTVIFRSVQELSEFMALANQQPFDVLFVRAGGVSNAKSMFSCLSLQLNSPQMVRILADGVDVSEFCQNMQPYLAQGATA